jgi:RES domain-containing protein
MECFRITHAQYADTLYASGRAGRWNSEKQSMIYTAASRSLACLENVVHRSGRGLNALFKVMVIYVPDDLYIEILDTHQLPEQWYQSVYVPECRQLGNAWLNSQRSPVLKVPSAIIPNEYNYLLNPLHPDFLKIRLIATENFRFDMRIKGQ